MIYFNCHQPSSPMGIHCLLPLLPSLPFMLFEFIRNQAVHIFLPEVFVQGKVELYSGHSIEFLAQLCFRL